MLRSYFDGEQTEGLLHEIHVIPLMPNTGLPDDFREKKSSVWVEIHSLLFDPKRAHLMCNDFTDELECDSPGAVSLVRPHCPRICGRHVVAIQPASVLSSWTRKMGHSDD